MLKWLRRERSAYLSLTGNGQPFPPSGTAVEAVFWRLRNIRTWWRNLLHPLSEEEKRRGVEDLLNGPKS